MKSAILSSLVGELRCGRNGGQSCPASCKWNWWSFDEDEDGEEILSLHANKHKNTSRGHKGIALKYPAEGSLPRLMKYHNEVGRDAIMAHHKLDPLDLVGGVCCGWCVQAMLISYPTFVHNNVLNFIFIPLLLAAQLLCVRGGQAFQRFHLEPEVEQNHDEEALDT